MDNLREAFGIHYHNHGRYPVKIEINPEFYDTHAKEIIELMEGTRFTINEHIKDWHIVE